MLEHGYYALLNYLIHAFGNSILLWTIGCRVFTSIATFSANFDEFFRFELSPIVGLKAFQLLTGLIFDHGEPVKEDREHLILVWIG